MPNCYDCDFPGCILAGLDMRQDDCDDFVKLVDPYAKNPLTAEDMNLIRQWFNAICDLSPHYLEEPDYVTAGKVFSIIGLEAPKKRY